MTNKDDIKQAILSQLGNAEDNLHRANAAFRGLGTKELAEQHGDSDQSRKQVLEGYQQEVDRWKRALEALNSL
jgi:hypothetical protein